MTGSEGARPDVSCGPFDEEPFDLGRMLVAKHPRSGDDVVQATTDWLLAILADAGVELGTADRQMVELIAGDGWSVAQVVGGWVARAHDDTARWDP